MKLIEILRNKYAKVKAPSSKAHTLRALILGSMAHGNTVIYNPLLGEDQLNLIDSLKKLGVNIQLQDNKILVEGKCGRFEPQSHEINLGESGVGMNFLSAAASLSNKPIILTGKESLLKRPIKEVIDGLIQLGCKIEYLEKEGFPPIKVYNNGIVGGESSIHGAKTSQYFSSITISAPYAQKDVVLNCIDDMNEKPYYDITLDIMEEFGVTVKNDNYKKMYIPKGQYTGKDIYIEGDYSNASYFFLGAAICKSKITVEGLKRNSVQGDKEILTILEKMGCQVSYDNDSITLMGGELKSIEYNMGDLPDLVPTVAIAAAFAKGTSIIHNIGHLRNKESDRISAVTNELTKMGAQISFDENSIQIVGGRTLHGALINTYNDHRIAMSFATAGLVTGNQRIENEMCVAKSFPDFWDRFDVFYK
jgi:3-phosphoshikimate 1-carboxyvinyltransferase